MMKLKKKQANRSIILLFLAISFMLYFLYFLFSRDLSYILDSFILKLAFLPIYILFTTLLVDGLLASREHRINERKKNMIIGVFYTEIGKRLITQLSAYCQNSPDLIEHLDVSDEWTPQSFQLSKQRVKSINLNIGITCSLDEVHELLFSKRDFMIQLLQNPNILEDESFTNLLLATFHLSEELIIRNTGRELSTADTNHLAGDVKRIYSLIIVEWLAYLEHLSKNYPFLFKLEVMSNPLKQESTA